MINNCQKCGNPLQEGTTSCPICGTNIIATSAQAPAPVAQEAAPAAQVAAPTIQPVVAQPTVAPVVEQPVAPSVETQVVQATPAPVVEAPAPVAQTSVAQVVQPQPAVVEVQTQPVAATTDVQPVQTIAPVEEVAPAPVAPAIEPTVAPQIAPATPTVAPAAIAQSLEALAAQTPAQPVVDAPAVEVNKPKAKKIDIKNLTKNQKIIAVAAVAVIIMVIVGISLSSSSLGKPVTQTPSTTPVETALTKEVATNGYKLKLEKDWIIEEGSGNIIIKKEDDSVIINVKNTISSIDTLNKETLTTYFNNQSNFKDVKVEETELSGKKTFIVSVTYALNGTNTEYPVQYYYINGGTNLIIGSAIVYQDEDAKTNNAAFITNLMGTMSYSDDTIKALDTINMYSEVFQNYIFSIRTPITPSVPTIEETPTESTETQS